MGVQHYKDPRRTIPLCTKKVLRRARMYLLLRTNELLRRTDVPAAAHAQAAAAYTGKEEGYSDQETAHDARHCPEYPNLDKDSHPPAAARGRCLSDATTLGIEVENGQSKKMTMKTPVAPAAACARKTPYSGGRTFGYNKWPINSTTTKAGVTPASGTSENPGAVYTAAQYLETEEQ